MKPKHLDVPLVLAGKDHETLLLHVSRWDTDQTILKIHFSQTCVLLIEAIKQVETSRLARDWQDLHTNYVKGSISNIFWILLLYCKMRWTLNIQLDVQIRKE